MSATGFRLNRRGRQVRALLLLTLLVSVMVVCSYFTEEAQPIHGALHVFHAVQWRVDDFFRGFQH